jgi:general transcription factor 3C polypeptide 3 (transcription factor C subunit 4)
VRKDDAGSGEDESEDEDSLPSAEESTDEGELPGVDGPSAQVQIEGDFESVIINLPGSNLSANEYLCSRLVQNIRGADGSSGAMGMLSQMWDFNLEEREAEFKDDLRAASGIGRRKGKKV